MKTIIYFIVLLCSALLLSCTPFNKKTIIEPVESESVELTEIVPTVYEVLQEREDWKYQNYIDSVYLQMPEQVITHMLVTKGTTITPQEIVEDYLANKQFYHDTILKSMNIQKEYIPDSLPKASKQDRELSNKDSTNHLFLTDCN